MKRMVILLIFVAALLLSACSDPKNEQIKTRCINGVLYYYIQTHEPYAGYGFMAPAYNRNGTVKTCK